MWLLGGEIIRDVNEDPRLRKVATEQLARNVIHEGGGPLIHNGWEDEQSSFDSTCHKILPFPHSNPALSQPVTHRFPRRAISCCLKATVLRACANPRLGAKLAAENSPGAHGDCREG